MRCAIVGSTVLFLSLLAGRADGQSASPSFPIDSGRAVRVTTAAERRAGQLLAPYGRESEMLRFCAGVPDHCTSRSVASRDLLRLEVRTGTRAKTGAIIGGAAGAVVGGFIGLMAAGVCDAASCPSLGRGVLVGGLVGALPMAAVGGLIGSLIPKWESMP